MIGLFPIIVAAFVLWPLLWSSPALAAGSAEIDRGRVIDERPRLDAQANQQSNQLYQGDLRVERGQTIEGDTVVYDGDIWIESEGRISGNLVVFRGDVTLAEGGTVTGNLDLFGGDATIGGTVHGNLALWNGDVTLQESAQVGGDVSVLNGQIRRSEGAVVGGSMVEGPSFDFSSPGAFPGAFGFGPWGTPPVDSTVSRPLTVVQWVGAFLARLLGAVMLTGFIAVLVGLAVHVRPDGIARVRSRMVQKPAISFVIGLVVNLVLLFLGGLLAITICLLPIALVPMLALLAINLLGWAALAQWVGNRVETYVDRPMESWVSAAVGAVLITGFFSLLWAFGGFFRFMGGSILLFTASFGAGAVLLPWVMRVLQPRDSAARRATADAAPGSTDVSSGGGVASISSPTPATPVVQTPPVQTPAQDISIGETIEDRLDAAARPDSRAAGESDFTELKGVGPVLDGRLKDAGVMNFGQLAALSPAEVAEIFGWTEERVTRSEILEQARDAAQDS